MAARQPRIGGSRRLGRSIVTTKANEIVARLHVRTPVILPPSAWHTWLDSANADTTTLARLLVPAPAELVTAYPVRRL